MNENAQARIAESLAEPYTRVCRIWEDGRFAAEVLEFPGCFASGDTAAEAMEQLEDAMASWIQGELEDGHDIPEPTLGPYSGRISVRLGPRLHERAAQLAHAEGISLNRWLTTAIATYAGELSTHAPAGRVVLLVEIESLEEGERARVREARGAYAIVEQQTDAEGDS